jgi:hypothetical protein
LRGLRNLLGLEWDGDGKSDYFGKKYQTIHIEVREMAQYTTSEDMLADLRSAITNVTGKQTTLGFGAPIAAQSTITADQLHALASQSRSTAPPDAALLEVFLVSRDTENAQTLGTTVQENAIALYIDRLKEFTEDTPKTYTSYFTSTLLHEFGHQLGLGHNETPGCLMNAKAETDNEPKYDPRDVVMSFCAGELSQLTKLRAAY